MYIYSGHLLYGAKEKERKKGKPTGKEGKEGRRRREKSAFEVTVNRKKKERR